MAQPLGKIQKPSQSLYTNKRKLLLVPNFLLPGNSDEQKKILSKYWQDLVEPIQNLEKSLEKISHVYHELLYLDQENGLTAISNINPHGHFLVETLIREGAQLDITEDRELLAESTDWQRCMSIGLVSQSVITQATESFQKTTKLRYEAIANNIDKTLQKNETGILFISEGHAIQFPSDIEVFYVTPPSIEDIKNFIQEEIRQMQQRMNENISSPDTTSSGENNTEKDSPKASK
jgi:hypothetical protein